MSGTAGGGGRVLGSVGSAGGRGVVRVRDRYDTGIDDLWSALTEPDRLARWLGEVEGDLRVGGRFRARFLASEWEGTGLVEACESPHRLLVLMVGADEADEHVMEVTLSAEGELTVLVIEERGMPLDQRAAYGAGLQVHAEDLAAHLVRDRRCDALARWAELLPAYRDLVAADRP